MKVPALVKALKAASERYYSGEGNSLLSDEQFDAMKEELRARDPENAFLTETGAPVPAKAQKVKHAIRLGSLENAFGLDDIKKWVKRISASGKAPKYVVVQEKADGLTVNLSYRGGELTTAATRGDGEEGEDVTYNVIGNSRVPRRIACAKDVDVRCEARISRANFEKHFLPQGYTNARAAAAGTLRNRKAGALKDLLDLYAFSAVLPEELEITSEQKVINWLSEQGFTTVDSLPMTLDADALFNAAEAFNANRAKAAYDADGFVVKVNDLKKQSSLGWSGNCPVGCIAIKWRGSMVAETEITGLITQVGRTGAITPVAIVTPVLCGGVTIERISLMNWDEIQRVAGDQKIGVGAKVKIERSGEVIPRILEVLDGSKVTCAFQRPEHCPSCGAEAVTVGPRQMCGNPECPAQSFRKVLGWIKGRNILHFGEKTLDALMAIDGPVDTIGDIYRLTEKQLAKASGDAMAKKILAEIDKSRSCTPTQLLGNVGIAGIGEVEAAKVEKNFDASAFEVLRLSLSRDNPKLASLLGPVRAEKFLFGFMKYESVIADLYELLDVGAKKASTAEGAWSGKTFCATGPCSIGRTELVRILEEAGGEYKTSVVNGLDYLITNDTDTGTKKNMDAARKGVAIITEIQALEMAGHA